MLLKSDEIVYIESTCHRPRRLRRKEIKRLLGTFPLWDYPGARGMQAIYRTASCWDWVPTQVNGQGKRARRMGKWEMNKCYEFLLSYLFGFLFVHCTHWKYACCEIVALYCVEVLRIPKQLPLWTDLYAHWFALICMWCWVSVEMERVRVQ